MGNLKDFVNDVVRLLQDEELWLRLANAGRERVNTLYNWQATMEELEAFFVEINHDIESTTKGVLK